MSGSEVRTAIGGGFMVKRDESVRFRCCQSVCEAKADTEKGNPCCSDAPHEVAQLAVQLTWRYVNEGAAGVKGSDPVANQVLIKALLD